MTSSSEILSRILFIFCIVFTVWMIIHVASFMDVSNIPTHNRTHTHTQVSR